MRSPPSTDDEGKLGLTRQVEVSMLAGLALEADLIALLHTVLLHILLCTLEHQLALLLVALQVQSVMHTHKMVYNLVSFLVTILDYFSKDGYSNNYLYNLYHTKLP